MVGGGGGERGSHEYPDALLKTPWTQLISLFHFIRRYPPFEHFAAAQWKTILWRKMVDKVRANLRIRDGN